MDVIETVREENPLGKKKVGKLLAEFAIPSIIAMVVSSLYNMVDQIFIGQGVGYLGNAATNVSFPLVTICMSLTLSIGIGSATQFSLSLGRKQEKEAEKVAGSAVLMMILFGTLYLVLVEIFMTPLLGLFGGTPEIMPYAVDYTRIVAIGFPFLMMQNGICNLARADGSPRFSMLAMLVGAVINTILDPIFIFPLQMGVKGAAIATIIGQIASCLVALTYLKRFRRITLKREDFTLSFRRIGRTFVFGMSHGLTQLAITLVQVVMNQSLVYYGAASLYGSEIPLAAAGIVMKVNGIILAVYIGIAQGMQPIVGYNYGASHYQRVRKTYYLCVAADFLIGLAGLIVFQLFPEAVLALFGTGDQLYMDFSVRFIRTFLLLLPLNGIQMLSSNLFSAIGKPVKGTLLSLTRTTFILIPMMLLLPLAFGIQGLLISAPITDGICFTLTAFFIVKELRRMKREE